MIEFFIPGNPIPLKRHRHYKNRVYDPQKEEKLVTGCLIRQHSTLVELTSEPLEMTLTFYFKIPKNRPVPSIIDGKMCQHHSQKPDLDNLIKFICDVMNDIIYKDDSQICKITATKQYCIGYEEAGTNVIIKKVKTKATPC